MPLSDIRSVEQLCNRLRILLCLPDAAFPRGSRVLAGRYHVDGFKTIPVVRQFEIWRACAR